MFGQVLFNLDRYVQHTNRGTVNLAIAAIGALLNRLVLCLLGCRVDRLTHWLWLGSADGTCAVTW